MPRCPRVHMPGGLYHAVLRGNHCQAIFRCAEDYLRFEEVLATALDRYGAVLLAYCWMTNHVHLAIRVADAPLGEIMRSVASRYARRLQREIPTTGHLFERRYRARVVDSDRYLTALVRYIHLNPVRAAIVLDARDYRWSSHGAYLGRDSCPHWLAIDPVLETFGSFPAAARAAYQRFMVDEPGEEEIEQLQILARSVRLSPGTRGTTAMGPVAASMVRRPRTLEAILEAVAREHCVSHAELTSRRRERKLVQARVAIARTALREGAATLSEVARRLGRAPSTLSDLLRGRT